ncbi:MAG: hypothetical protein Kow0025_26020 [Thermodesulfovibrionales bacterium]
MLKTAVMYVVYLAEALAILFILFGILGALFIYARKTYFIKTDYRAFVMGRHHLGHCLSLSLEFLIGADILKTAISPTWQDIGQLASIVGIRTVLNFFLSKELQQMSALERAEAGGSAPGKGGP